jgi:hypothetical protein
MHFVNTQKLQKALSYETIAGEMLVKSTPHDVEQKNFF